MPSIPQQALKNAILFVATLALPTAATAMTVGNPLCPGEEVLFNPDNGQDIVLPEGFKVSVFVSGLNFPTGIGFRGDSRRFEVYVVEAGRFPTSPCNDAVAWQAKGLPGNPFTSAIRVFDQNAKLLRTLGNRRMRRSRRPIRSMGRSILHSNAASTGGGCSRRTTSQAADASSP